MEERKKLFSFQRFSIHNPHTKQLALLAASLAAIVIFFIPPANFSWLKSRIITPLNDVRSEYKKMDIPYRMQYRFDSVYAYSKQIESLCIAKKLANNSLILLPSTNYFKLYHINFHVPEPVVFYYFTGIKTLWPNSSNAADANWYVSVKNNRLFIDSVTSKQALADTIASYNKPGVSL